MPRSPLYPLGFTLVPNKPAHAWQWRVRRPRRSSGSFKSSSKRSSSGIPTSSRCRSDALSRAFAAAAAAAVPPSLTIVSRDSADPSAMRAAVVTLQMRLRAASPAPSPSPPSLRRRVELCSGNRAVGAALVDRSASLKLSAERVLHGHAPALDGVCCATRVS